MIGVSRSERLWVVAVLGVAIFMRFLAPGSLAIEHFDEGVYAGNLWFGQADRFEYPGRAFYAPPLWPAVIEFCSLTAVTLGFGLRGVVPLLPGILAGIATVASAWWIVRYHAGPRCAIVAAILIATADFHIAYSRTALTDVPVTLIFVWTWHFLSLAIATGKGLHVGAAGLLIGLAWWTKYNGWLPLAVGLFAGIVFALVERFTLNDWLAGLKRGTIVGVIALVVWSPVLWGLQSLGGYAAISANHRQYMHGIEGWSGALAAQSENLQAYEGIGTVVGLILLAGYLSICNSSQPGRWNPMIFGGIYLGFKWIASPLLLEMAFGVYGIIRFLQAPREQSVSSTRCPPETRFFLVFLACWIVTLLILTPFYRPYPRLVLPLYLGVVFAMGLGWTAFADHVQKRSFRDMRGLVVGMILIAVAANFIIPQKPVLSGRAWQDRTAYQSFADRWEGVLRSSGQQQIIYVWGEPAMFHHLRARGFELVGPIQSLDFVNQPMKAPTFLIVGPHASKDRSFQSGLAKNAARLEPLDAGNLRVSEIVSRDDHSSPAAIAAERHPLTLYRLR